MSYFYVDVVGCIKRLSLLQHWELQIWNQDSKPGKLIPERIFLIVYQIVALYIPR